MMQTRTALAVVAIMLIAPLPAQQGNASDEVSLADRLAAVEARKENEKRVYGDVYDRETGLITPVARTEDVVWIVTTETVPGMACEAVGNAQGQFPAMIVTPRRSLEPLPGLASDAQIGMEALRQRAVDVGANAVVGLRFSTYVEAEYRAEILLYGTFARCSPHASEESRSREPPAKPAARVP